MLVVNTTSATVGGGEVLNCPRKRVPSSRRRNPGVELGSATLRSLGRWCRSRCLRVAARSYGLDGKNIGARLCRCWRDRSRGRREGLVQNRTRRRTLRRGQRQEERQSQEDCAAPPAGLREQVPCLPRAEDCVRRAGDSAKTGGQAATLSGLQENGGNENHAVDD